MSKLILGTLDKMVKLEEKNGMLGTVIGCIIIAAAIIGMFFGIKLVIETGFVIIEWALNTFFDISLYSGQ